MTIKERKYITHKLVNNHEIITSNLLSTYSSKKLRKALYKLVDHIHKHNLLDSDTLLSTFYIINTAWRCMFYINYQLNDEMLRIKISMSMVRYASKRVSTRRYVWNMNHLEIQDIAKLNQI